MLSRARHECPSAETSRAAVRTNSPASRCQLHLTDTPGCLRAMMLGNSVWESTLQRHIPAESLSRVSAYDWFGSLAFYPLELAVWGQLQRWLGLEPRCGWPPHFCSQRRLRCLRSRTSDACRQCPPRPTIWSSGSSPRQSTRRRPERATDGMGARPRDLVIPTTPRHMRPDRQRPRKVPCIWTVRSIRRHA
jgi:hypothetical protein